jgi:hypothetical protein
MRAQAQFSKPGEIEATIEVTATLKQWEELREHIKDAPYYGIAGKLSSAIVDLSLKLCGRVGYEPPEQEGE